MEIVSPAKKQLTDLGHCIMEEVYTPNEISALINAINEVDPSGQAFRKTSDLFAIRQFLKEVPKVQGMIFNNRLNTIIHEFFGNDYFIVKSIYFDKPEQSNWFVSYHQDLTIVVDKKIEQNGFSQWTVKQHQFGVQPPLDILENIFTIRIHLDDTDENNGALKVIPGSHQKGIYRPETIDWTQEHEVACNVKKGNVMIMRPLLLHASNRTTNYNRRRVIHIEFSNVLLPGMLQWAEFLEIKN